MKRPNVDALGRSLTAKQFINWEAYAAIEPFFQEHTNLLFASVVQMIHNMAVKKEHQKESPADFLLKYVEREPGSSPNDSRPSRFAAKQPVKEKVAFAKIIVEAWNSNRGPKRKKGSPA